MTVRDMYLELKKLGFTIGIISKHTGISIHKINNMVGKNSYFFTDAEKAAFQVYYEHGKYMAKVYGERLAEYLAHEQNKA